MAHKSGYSLAAVAGLAAILLAADSPKQAYTTWSDYGGAADSMQYSALKQINKSNVSKLELAWTYKVPDHRGNFGFNPIVVDGTMYVLGQNNAIVALDAATGRQIWSHPSEQNIVSQRGIMYWQSKDGKDRRLIFGAGSYLYAINAQTGAGIPTFGDDGRINMRVGTPRPLGGPSATPGRIWENRIIVGSQTGEGYGSRSGRPARLRRRHRQAALDVPHDPASRRVRLRHVAQGRLDVCRRGQYLGRDLGRREARHRLLPARLADSRHVRRRPQGREPLRRLHPGARPSHRQAPVALPAGPSRPVGLRPDDRAEASHREARRQDGRHRRAADQVRTALRVRPGDRRAALADRGAAGAEERRAGRGVLADAAVPDQAAAVRAPQLRSGRHQSVCGRGGARAPAQDRAGVRATKACSRR